MWKKIPVLLVLIFAFFATASAQKGQKTLVEYDAERFSYYDTVASYYQEKIDACPGCADTTLGHLYLDLAQAFQYDNRSTEAYASLEKARLHLEKTRHLTLLAEMYISFAEYFRVAAQYSKALSYLEKVEALMQNGTIEKRTLARYYNRKAAIAIEYEINFALALKFSKECLKLGKELKDNALIATALNEIGYIQENEGDTAALRNYLEAYRLMTGEKRLLDACNILANYGRFRLKRCEYEQALGQTLEGYSLAVENNFERPLAIFADHLVKIYTYKKDFKMALFYLEKKQEADERIHRKIWGRTVSELEKKYELRHKEEQIELSNLKIDNQELALKRERSARNNVIMFLVFTSGLLGVVAFYYFRTNRYNRRLKGLLNQNQFLLGESNHRIKNNLQLISALTDQELKKIHRDEDRSSLLAISAKIEAISTLHKLLYLTESKETIRIDTYMAGIRENFMVMLQKRNIRMEFEVEAIELNIHTSTYIGLMCTELILNSLKHAFNEMTELPEIRVIVRLVKGKVFFNYSDNGSGMKDKTRKLHLIDLISRQLRFNYRLENVRGFYFETSDLV